MANDQIQLPIDLRPLSINRTSADEPRIAVGRTVEGYYPSSSHEAVSPRSRSLFYPVTVSDSGFVGAGPGAGVGLVYSNPIAAAWYPRQQQPPIAYAGGISPTGYTPSSRIGGNGSEGDDASAASEDLSPANKKVKFMCSFGGKILPRPSDGALRYVGGQTRIISLRRDVSFQELMQKMVETYGQNVGVKYQLPEEDLDALVSISCPEDLENMMDEYSKLVESSSEGSAKLRLFLFSPAELDQSGLMQFTDLHDSGQKYVDAVNGVPDIVGGKLTRRGSTASAASTQNSDSLMNGGDPVDHSNSGTVPGDGGGVPSPTILSPKVSQEAGTRVVYVGPNPVMYTESPTVTAGHATVLTGPPPSAVPDSELARSAHAMGQPQQPVAYDLHRSSGLDFPPQASYMQAYVDPQQEAYNRVDYSQISSQMGYLNPQAYGTAGPFYRRVDHPQQIPDNTGGYPPQQFIHMSMAPSVSTVNIRPNGAQQFIHPQQLRVNPYPEETLYGARVVQVPGDQIHRTYQPQPTPQQVPTQVQGGGYEWRQVPTSEHLAFPEGWSPTQQKAVQEQTGRVEDCHMCQKALPHAHSDTVVLDYGGSPMSNNSDTNVVFHSLRSDDDLRFRVQHRVAVSGQLEQGTLEHFGARAQPRVVGNMDQQVTSPHLGTVGFTESPKVQFDHENIVLHKCENQDQSKICPGGTGLTGDINSPYGAFIGNTAQTYQVDALGRPTASSQYQVKKETNVMNQPLGTDIPFVKATPSQTSEALVHEYSTQALGKHPALVKEDILAVNGKMEAMNLSPLIMPEKNEPLNQLRKEVILDTRSQLMGKDTPMTNAFTRPGMVPDEDHSQPDKLSSTTSEIVYFRGLHPVEPARVVEPTTSIISGQYIDIGTGAEHKRSDDLWHAQSSFLGVDSTYQTDRMTPISEWINEASQFHPRMISNDASVSPSGNSPSALSPSSAVGDGRDPATSNSLFSNQDPWTLRHGTQFPPPRPNKVSTGKETFAMRDDRVLHQLPGNLNKDRDSEQGRCFKEENIRQELQAVAEGVAASVFQASVPSELSSSGMSDPIQEVHQHEVPKDDTEGQSSAEVEDAKTKDKTNIGLPISDGIGRLQIIKNSDLEELRELGSGTFGTVYHGKWRGTDVAIKRINERCFVGKPSEQDRMRNDFWNEAIKLADLHHPNVVAFYGVVVDGPGGSVATVTEFMVNGSLRQAFQRNDRTLDKRKRLLIAMDVAFGMEYLHGKNIVHFDLKSDNLLVNLRDPHRPICKVGDLGLSKVKCQTLISGGVRGTLPWMAPELLNGSSNLVSEKVDVFSFGIVMWELITGEEPYADLHYGAIIGGIVSNTLRPPAPESCDLEWKSLMERCWSSEPPERPNFTEIANQLRSMAASVPPKGQIQQQ